MIIEDLLNKLICGDSLKLIEEVPSNSINLIITSPPYFQQRIYTSSELEIGREKNIQQYVDINIKLMKEFFRVISPDGSVIINMGDKYIDSSLSLIPYRFAIGVLDETDFKLVNNITWVKSNPMPIQHKNRLLTSTEPFFHFVKSKSYKFDLSDLLVKKKELKSNLSSKVGFGYFKQIDESNLTEGEKALAKIELQKVIDEVKDGKLSSLRMKIRGKHSLPFGGQSGGRATDLKKKGYSIIKVPGNSLVKDVFNCSVETIKGIQHPAIYPKDIVIKLIKILTLEEDIVLDPFVGSGTTVIACKELNRQYIGFDLNEDFINYAKSRT